MMKSSWAFACLLLIQATALAAPPALTLDEIVAIAQKRLETVELQQTQTQLAKEALIQFQSRLYPKIAFLIDYTRIQEPTSTTASGVTQVLAQPNQYDARFAFTLLTVQ